ncbi:MAG TPA: hypothetical protein VGB45_05835 [Abditibacterium sp.]|jgi:hypothetical protein
MNAPKWIFAYSQGSEASYEALIRVAVASARGCTSLQPTCLYDGEPTKLTSWLESQNVQVVPCRSTLHGCIEKLARQRSDATVLTIGRGAFLRFEIPRIAREQGWNDEFVFYSDCDVMFQSDPAPILQPLRPHIFAAAPEHSPTSPLHMNSGAMWINMREWERQSTELVCWTERHFERVWNAAWDQGALRVFFNPLHRALWKIGVPDRIGYGLMSRLPFKTWKWDDLPNELNWKPYWGENHEAPLIHFHGPKPGQRELLDRGELPAHLAELDGTSFRTYAAQWDEWLKKTRS